jgi:hypothetical protein
MLHAAYVICTLLILCLAQAGCTHRRTASAPPPRPSAATRSDFVDLQAGWRIRVVVPMLRSGGYLLPSLKTEAAGNTMNLEAGDDFLGYEQAYYKVTARREGGVRVRFSYADVWEKGKTHRRHKPLLDVFQEAAGARHVRLVFLIRVSQADHDMAIVSADDPAALDELTRAVVRRAECGSSRNVFCRWVPNGVAVTPERD